MQERDERLEAELEFLSSAYNPDEAWHEYDTTNPRQNLTLHIHRILPFPHEVDNEKATDSLKLQLTLTATSSYLIDQPLQVSGKVVHPSCGSSISASVVKAAYQATPDCASSCQEVSNDMTGEEAVFAILSHAETWLADHWQDYQQKSGSDTLALPSSSEKSLPTLAKEKLVLGRKLIYSHHLIAKSKRTAMHHLASNLHLSGYMKIGWPGIIIVEGLEADCVEFYDTIRKWQWQYLVLRGEMHQQLTQVEKVDRERKFEGFTETEDMSEVARKCKDVGLEALFQTSMKRYNHANNDDENDNAALGTAYGSLVHVKNQHNLKDTRAWLDQATRDMNCTALVKQCYRNFDFSERPTVVAVIVGEEDDKVQAFLNRWRTRYSEMKMKQSEEVDINVENSSEVHDPLEVLCQGSLEHTTRAELEKKREVHEVNTNEEQGLEFVYQVGGETWRKALEALFSSQRM